MVLARPSTSPVDFISGPRCVSTSTSFSEENTGTFTATYGEMGYNPVPYSMSASFSPSIARVAKSTIGTPVTLLIYGMVREERGFTSITYNSP